MPPINKRFVWIGIVLLIKLLFLAIYYSCFYPVEGMSGLVFINKDYIEFYQPIENFVTTGDYSFDGEPYAGRMPGYIFPALLIRFFFNEAATIHITVALQILLAAIATYYFSKMLSEVLKRKFVFYVVVVMLTVFSAWPNFETSFHPTSFAISSFLLSIYCFYRFTMEQKFSTLILLGALLTWISFLRPFLLIYFFTFSLALLFFLWKKKLPLKIIVTSLFIFYSPLVLTECSWVVRNYFSLGRIIPLQDSFAPGEKAYTDNYGRRDKYSLQVLRNLIYAWGGSNLWYVNGTEMNWFTSGPVGSPPFSDYVYCSAYNDDSLRSLKKEIVTSLEPQNNKARADSLEKAIITKVQRYTSAYKREKKIRVLVVSPFYRIKNFIARNIVSDWPGPSFSGSGIIYKILKLGVLSVYGAVIIFSIFGIVYMIRRPEPLFFLITLNLLGLLAMFAFVINFSHPTYFFTGIVCCLALTIYGVNRTAEHIKSFFTVRTSL